MRKFGLISCSMLYSLSTFLMFGKHPLFQKEAGILLALSGVIFVMFDFFLGYLQRGSWLDRYGKFAKSWQGLIVLVALLCMVGELILLSFGSAFLISIVSLSYTPVVVIAGSLVGTSLVLSWLKEDRLLSFAALLGWMFLFGFVVLVLVGLQVPNHQILPFHSLSAKTISEGVWYYGASVFVHSAVLTSFVTKEDRGGVRTGILFASGIYLVTYLGNLYVLDAEMIENFHFPTISSASIMSYGNFVQRLEMVAVFGILLCDVIKLAILLRFLYRLLRVFASQLWTRGLMVGCTVLVLAIGAWWFPSYDVWLLFHGGILMVFGGGCALLWLIS